jgi:superfamily I DNA/RNA helicase
LSKPIVIIGPPGTGKTTFILNKIEEYIQQEVKIDEIAFFSFSNKAVDEAKQRAADRFKIPANQLENFSTLHSFALRQMSLTREYIMSKNDWRNISNVLRININVSNDDDSFFNSYDEKYIHLIEKAKRRDISLDDAWAMFAQDIVKHKLDYIAKGLQEYKDYGYENFTDGVTGFMVKDVGPKKDFTDLITDYVKSNKVKQFKVVFFDEAQDMSTIQWKMAEKIWKAAETSYIAMDPNQAIYTWADADVLKALEVKEDAKELIVLDESKRVPRKVWEVVNRVEEQINSSEDIEWRPAQRDGQVEFIRNVYHLDMSRGSWLIMGRTRSIREDLEEMLVKKNVFFRVKMRDNKYRYSIKSQERNAILTWKDLTIYKNSVSLKMIENMYKVLGKDFVTRGYKKIVSEQRKALPDKKVSFDELKNNYGLVADINQSWVEVMTTLNTETRAYLENLESRGEDIGKEPRITLSTIHQQKGGEAENVIVSLDIGKMAYDDYKKNPVNEHRLFYVAFSRAKENLYIITPTSREAYRV